MKARLVSTQELSDRDRNAMYSLLSTHFEGVKSEVFAADLQEKNWVILLEDETDTLKGFSTLLMYNTCFEGETISVVYSGDTITDPSAWSSLLLPRTWVTAVNTLRQQYPQQRLYWLLICSGYRTYRFLPTFWQEFYPRYDVTTPAKTQALLEFLSRDRFGRCYNEKTGIVSFPHPQALREGLRGIPPERLHDPHIRFFAEKNPEYLQGDELVCLTEFREENLTRAGRRMFPFGVNRDELQLLASL